MSAHVRQTIAMLEQELEVIQDRCAQLTRAIDTLRPLTGDHDDEPAPRKAATRVKSERRAKPTGRQPRLADDGGATIVAVLKKHGGSMSPGDLAKAIDLPIANLRYRVKALERAKTVVVTGTTMSRRVSLPGKSPAKEAP